MGNERAVTDEQKRAVIERLLAAWCRMPALRLGQMLDSALMREQPGPDLFYVEDEDIARKAELLAESVSNGGILDAEPREVARHIPNARAYVKRADGTYRLETDAEFRAWILSDPQHFLSIKPAEVASGHQLDQFAELTSKSKRTR